MRLVKSLDGEAPGGAAAEANGETDEAGDDKRGAGVRPPVVLKFGGSILKSPDDLPAAVSEIYRFARDGRRVVAVVSAFAGETDRLWTEAAAFGGGLSSIHAPGLISLGEARAASLLGMACDQAGLAAYVMGARELGLKAEGPPCDAEPTGIDTAVFHALLQARDVVIAPGFIALNENGAPVLLGRGGSDLTAVLIAEALGAAHACLVKDVAGVFDRDPNAAGVSPADLHIFRRISWTQAEAVGGGVAQAKALRYAAARGLPIEVRALGADEGAVIAETDEPPVPFRPARPLKVALAGLGVVGEGLALRLLREPARFEIVSVLINDAEKPRHAALDPARLTVRPDDFLGAGADFLVDALSCGETGAALTTRAVEAGISVVSANKQAVCDILPGLRARGGETGAVIACAAAVGGGAPMVEAARAGAGEIDAIDAVLNGTVNFILSEMQEGAAFADALKAAQDAGFAEADPSADLSGDDARAKAKILAFEAFGVSPENVDVRAEALTEEKAGGFAASGGKWRQITRISRDGDHATALVRYANVDADPFFSTLAGEGNALRALRADGGVVIARGRGAGRAPTVESLLADLGDLHRAHAAREAGV